MRVGIDTPEFELALAILKKKIENLEMSVYNYYMMMLLTLWLIIIVKIFANLKGNLIRLIFVQVCIKSTKVDMKFALNCFKDDIQVKETHTTLTAETIIKTVANYYNLTLTQLVSKSRTANIALARHMAMYLIREFNGYYF